MSEASESKTTYITQPGSGQMFKNKFKNSDKHPDYKGEAVTPDGEKVQVAGWIQVDKTGEHFLSLKLQPEYKKPTATADDMLTPVPIVATETDTPTTTEPVKPNDDDLPF